MKRQLANPKAFIRPSLTQAWADYQVAVHLSQTEWNDTLNRKRRAYDAAMAKFQQSLEKIIGAVLLEFHPQRSELVFLHKYLSSEDEEVRGTAKAVLSKVLFYVHHAKGVTLKLRELEKHVPDPSGATWDGSGRLTALPRNAEYPYTDDSGRAVAPCEAYESLGGTHIRGVTKDIATLFKALSRMSEFSEVLGEFHT